MSLRSCGLRLLMRNEAAPAPRLLASLGERRLLASEAQCVSDQQMTDQVAPVLKGLFAYPSTPAAIGQCINGAIPQINAARQIFIEGWEHVDNWGKLLIEPILGRISEHDLLVADITRLNFNVTFEVGFALGAKKKILLVLNNGLESDERLFKEIGIYDTLGRKEYENTDQLTALLSGNVDPTPIHFANFRDLNAPVYILEKPARTDDVGRITSRIKKSRLRYRSFTPSEES